MPRAFLTPLVGLAVVSACGFTANPPQNSAIDSSVDVYIPDAGECTTLTSECIGSNSKLRKCEMAGRAPIDYDCDWGCNPNGTAHCAKLLPAGGFVTAADLDPNPSLVDVSLPDGDYTLDSNTGAITPGVRDAVPNINHGIDFAVRGKVGVFRFGKLTIGTGTITVTGTNAVALVSLSTITVGAVVDLQGTCTGTAAGPGGGAGGGNNSDGAGSGKGSKGYGSDTLCAGGGGGANGGDGGKSGALQDNSGSKFGTELIPQLIGGGGGGGGAAGNGADGGGGGGAIQLVANKRITISGGIHAGGCGGKTAGACGGAGGAGGTILIEAPVIDFMGSKLAVNGGGGGGGNNGTAGDKAQLSTTAANGGAGGTSGTNKGSRGGNGGDDQKASGSDAGLDSRCGGGGGGVGRMRFNTLSGTIVTSGTVVFSPQVSTGTSTTVTRGTAAVQ